MGHGWAFVIDEGGQRLTSERAKLQLTSWHGSKVTVLVQVEKYSRKVILQCEECSSEFDLLHRQVRDVFKDLIQPDDKLTFQKRDKDFDAYLLTFLKEIKVFFVLSLRSLR